MRKRVISILLALVMLLGLLPAGAFAMEESTLYADVIENRLLTGTPLGSTQSVNPALIRPVIANITYPDTPFADRFHNMSSLIQAPAPVEGYYPIKAVTESADFLTGTTTTVVTDYTYAISQDGLATKMLKKSTRNSDTKVYEFQYNSNEIVLQTTLGTSAYDIVYSFDGTALEEMYYSPHGRGKPMEWANYTYDTADRCIKEEIHYRDFLIGNRNYTYDNSGRCTAYDLYEFNEGTGSNPLISHADYTYDSLGNCAQITADWYDPDSGTRIGRDTVSYEYMHASDGHAFIDVQDRTSWYYAAVNWAVGHNITTGVTPTEFDPNSSCTRAQAVTFLWRAAGSPSPTTQNTAFTDIIPGQYYYDAVLWAVERGITTGTTATTFSPDDSCTRGQIVTFLHRFEHTPNAAGSGFIDVPINEYYYNAVSWAVENGITNGNNSEGTTFGPNEPCTRAHIVTFLYRDLMA